jgi:polyhydroxyalkanoate synthesis regulator phasin
MVFESVRGYVELASGLTDLTRARAMEAAQGLLSLPASSVATGTKMAGQATALADELLAAAAANRENITLLVRTEVDAAITRLGLVPVQKYQEAEAEAERLRAEVAKLRSAASQPAPSHPAKKAAAPTSKPKKAASSAKAVKKAAAPTSKPKKAAAAGGAVKKAAPRTAASTPEKKAATARRSAVTTRVKPADR